MGARRIYRGTPPYPGDQLEGLDYVQSADTMYLAHLGYPPYKAQRYAHTDWRFAKINFGPTVATPAAPTVTPATPNTTGLQNQTYKYVITAIRGTSPVEESRASPITSVTNDLSLNGNINTITIPALSGDITRYVVYKEQGGVYGYIGTSDGAAVVDKNLQPILTITPPLANNPFPSTDNYPGVVNFHQQRLMFGGTNNVINGVWGSRSADFENMDVSRPARADDALSFALVAEKVNAVTSLISLDDLVVPTTDAIFAVGGNQSGIITPSDLNPKRTSGRGSRKVKPLLVDNVAFFATSRANTLRTLGFSFDIQGYKSDNVTIFAPHLFKKAGFKRLVYQEEPSSCIYALLADGTLLAFTWEAEQQVWGWSRVVTSGTFEDIAVIPEGGFDRLYARIRRTINGVSRVFHERMALPHVDIKQACHLDCAYTQVYDAPVSRITGAYHLVGATVSMIYDGYVATGLTVSACDGGVDVPNGLTASTITIGLPYTGRLETLPAALSEGMSSNHVNRQQVADIIVRAIDTRGINIGASGAPLEQMEPKDGDNVVELKDVSAIDYRATPPGDWKDTSTIIIEQTQPLPAHIVSIFARLIVGNQ